MEAFTAINFHPRNAFAAFHKFWHVIFVFICLKIHSDFLSV